jgi:glyoxylase-like metal-dependent hydrolase (beta-lactamase superfamily II)
MTPYFNSIQEAGQMAEEALDKQRPINSPLKSRRFLWREPEYPVRWAFLKELREHDKTKKIYDVNPYAEVYQFRDNLYGILTESLDGMGDPWMYLVVGPEKAMLIDTGFGVGDLKGLVNEITGRMPLIVANTHAHFDHAYGNFQFERVYCHEYEVTRLEAKRNPHIWDYLFDEKGNCIWTEFDRQDIVPFQEYQIVGCPNGHLFDLGDGYEIELVFLPGHAPGHAAFLDKQNRILFAGDDACYGTVFVVGPEPGDPYGHYATVTAFRDELAKLVARRGEFDGIYPGHGVVDMGTIMLVNILETCEKVIADPENYDSKTEMTFGGVTRIRYNKMIYQSGYLSYGLAGV